jgi:hypothetical protein
VILRNNDEFYVIFCPIALFSRRRNFLLSVGQAFGQAIDWRQSGLLQEIRDV